jgi:cell division inhibitor SepF
MADGGAPMGALRKAGVWLGLVEDDDDRGYDDRSYRGYGDDFADEDDVDEAPVVAPRARLGSDRHGSDRHGSDRLGSDRLGSDRLGSDRLGSDRLGSDRLGSDRLGSDRLGSDRLGSDRLGSDRLGSSDRLLADRAPDRSEAVRPERQTVRSITRPSTTSSYASRDSVAIAPRAAVAERVNTVEEEDRGRYQITTLHPTTYNEARTIGEHFRDGVPVIMNLTEMDEADAKRLVDFAAGLAFGLRGTIERVTNRVFLLSPANVQVTAEDKARIAEGGFFNQS